MAQAGAVCAGLPRCHVLPRRVHELFADMVKSSHPAWENVTLRQVLARRAGVRHEPDGLAQVFNELVWPSRARLAWARFSGTLPQQRLEITRQALWRPPGIRS